MAGSAPFIGLDDTAQRTYSAARIALLVLLAVTLGVAAVEPESFAIELLLAGALVLAGSSVAGLLAFRFRKTRPTTVLMWVAPFDFIAFGMLASALHVFEDPMFPALLVAPVFYAFVVSPRQSVLVTAGAALVYAASHAVFFREDSWILIGFVMLKTLAIVLFGVIAIVWARRFRRKEEEIEAAAREKEALNAQLQRRVAELQAVSQITEIVHSTLDFDRVGPLLLDILVKVLAVDACAIFVIDRQKAETLFTASVGMSSSSVRVRPTDLSPLESGTITDSHFSCISILNHRQMMVVFCAEASAIDGLSAEDRLVLQAVASELMVAVENSELYKLTRRLAITDELTNLANYRYLQQRLDEEIERARRYRKDLSLLMLDTDEFKRFNDTQGHIAGDVALEELARVLKSNTREVDVVARYGGEEFSIILPETDAAGAFVVAEKIREAVARHEFPDAGGERGQHITVSVGLATYPTHAEDKESLLRLADDALYHAKNGGKDRVRSPWPRGVAHGTAGGEET